MRYVCNIFLLLLLLPAFTISSQWCSSNSVLNASELLENLGIYITAMNTEDIIMPIA